MYPKGWKQYRDMIKNNQTKPVADLNIFAARYRMAKSFKGIDFGHIAEKTQHSYFSALKVQLAHNALESLSRALKKKTYELNVTDANLSSSFRSGPGIKYISCLIQYTKPTLQEKLREWIGNENNHDLNRIAAATRHLLAHGFFTAHGCNVANHISIRKMLDNLSIQVFIACDQHFDNYLKSL